jgi:dihydrofolate reductase
MGRVVASEFVSVDGFYADKGGGLDWVVADDEHHDYSTALLERASLLVFGRVTWPDFESYWPRVGDDPAAPEPERVVGALLERIPKVVFSGTLDTARWRSTVRPAVTAEEITGLRDRAAGDVVIFGSGQVVQAIGRLGLACAESSRAGRRKCRTPAARDCAGPALRDRLDDKRSRLSTARGVPTAAGRATTPRRHRLRRRIALPIVEELSAVETIPALEELLRSDQRLVGDFADDVVWADELLQQEIWDAITLLRG